VSQPVFEPKWQSIYNIRVIPSNIFFFQLDILM
jgi:hypothetical protein